MPVKKSIIPKEQKSRSSKEEKNSAKENPTLENSVSARQSGKKFDVFNLLMALLIFLLVAALVYRYKGAFVAARVGNAFIYSWSLNEELRKRYGDSTLEALINVKLIEDELSKSEIKVSEAKVNEKIAEAEKNLNGESLEEALRAQGLTVEGLRKQLYLEAGIEKLFEEQTKVSSEDIDKFIADYGAQLQEGDELKKREEAEKYLKNEKLRTAVTEWLSQLRQKAKIKTYL